MSTTLTWPNFLWATDIHLDHVRKDKVYRKFFDSILYSDDKIVLLTGDLSICEQHRSKKIPKLIHHLGMLSDACAGKEVYYVLGNHDYWFSSINAVRLVIPTIEEEHPNLHWTASQSYFDLGEGTYLVGHDGWYDFGYQDIPRMGGMNDWNFIQDFRRAVMQALPPGNHEPSIKELAQRLATEGAAHVEQGIEEAIKVGAKRVLVMTHVPPFVENSLYQGRVDDAWVGCYTSKIMGDMLLKAAKENPTTEFLVLCGHSHGKAVHQPEPNLTCLTGHSEYGAPKLQVPLADFLRDPGDA